MLAGSPPPLLDYVSAEDPVAQSLKKQKTNYRLYN